MDQKPNSTKDAALRAVGRTVVNFQRLEHNLKLAAQIGPLNGTAQKIARDVAKRQERAATLTLGQAIQRWLENCCDSPEQFEGTADLFDVTFQTRFSIETDDETRSRHAKALSDLLEARNKLIHSRLAQFNWESPQACEQLVLELDRVNVAIAEQIRYVISFLENYAELSNVFVAVLESTEFAEGLRDI